MGAVQDTTGLNDFQDFGVWLHKEEHDGIGSMEGLVKIGNCGGAGIINGSNDFSTPPENMDLRIEPHAIVCTRNL
ncbi:hypothetical protein BPAE_0077g00240 [Botrytis paeoniae]|uniref:Uncharacterized protein n=1 Tax=Botrytis paeoniae TaxID=278948 RepID=A0A4Z1FLQ0_9HELO|nr:hypothetical protein BPAE_0077g00240 [Botrytis paeoniae]